MSKQEAMTELNAVVWNDKPIKLDQDKLSLALDELFALAADKEIRGLDYHIYGGKDDDTSDLDETVIAFFLITGRTDPETGFFHQDLDALPTRRIPLG
jgi:hypothetical protein